MKQINLSEDSGNYCRLSIFPHDDVKLVFGFRWSYTLRFSDDHSLVKNVASVEKVNLI